MDAVDPIRLLLVGVPEKTEFRIAAGMARDAGAEVMVADTALQALEMLRTGHAGLVMIDVALDVPALMAQLRAERFAVPVLACGIDAPAARAVAAIRAGARDYVPLPPQPELIAAALTAATPQPAMELVGDDAALRHAAGYARTLAASRAPVLVCGERGTGKKLMARQIHAASGRSGSFLAVECAGVAADIVEAELFGQEAGAFPGAVARRHGALEKATNGTLFLRDVDCLAPGTQAKLLAALSECRVRRLGGGEAVPIDARLIASTSRNLDDRVQQGSFRADLLARLTLVQVALPPLRERMGDVPLLVRHFVGRLAATHGLAPRPFGPEAMALLCGYDWPCNVRELEDLVHRALLLATGDSVAPEAIVLTDGSRIFLPAAAEPTPCATGRTEVEALVGRTVEEVERELILQTLERCHGNRTSASSILGISVRTMRNKLKSFIEAGIPVAPAA
ncbi:sigma-54-dependent transcriptional regulator [Sphingomonas sp. ac-8]|uniref:sigma-54-dependent transcriptional regulator n=1 Tax=Sphingomonas sp. ac-8 TaxID=3242977 RepID=UPI003A7F9701